MWIRDMYRDASVRQTDGSYRTGKEALRLTRSDQHADEQAVSTKNNSANTLVNSNASRFHNDDSYIHGFESLNPSSTLTGDLSLNNNGGPSGVYANDTSLVMRVHGHRKLNSGNSLTTDSLMMCPDGQSSTRKKQIRIGNKIGASVGLKIVTRFNKKDLTDSTGSWGYDRSHRVGDDPEKNRKLYERVQSLKIYGAQPLTVDDDTDNIAVSQ